MFNKNTVPSSVGSLENLEQELGITMSAVREKVAQSAERVAKLGEWPPYIQPGSLSERIPKPGETNAAGFDAGLACALELIPLDKQELSARLHAAYTKNAVIKVRDELKSLGADDETAWWLAACSVCKEGGIDEASFLNQIKEFKQLAENADNRLVSARKEFEHMASAFTLRDGVPFGEKDGCIQGAYIAGYSFGTQFNPNYGLYFIGTYEDSLGLEDFPWGDEKDEQGRTKSGPVFGSKQFVKCATEEEFNRAVAIVKSKLPARVEPQM